MRKERNSVSCSASLQSNDKWNSEWKSLQMRGRFLSILRHVSCFYLIGNWKQTRTVLIRDWIFSVWNRSMFHSNSSRMLTQASSLLQEKRRKLIILQENWAGKDMNDYYLKKIAGVSLWCQWYISESWAFHLPRASTIFFETKHYSDKPTYLSKTWSFWLTIPNKLI